MSLRVLMLDPSGSSVNSTHNLCNYLTELGCDVHVYTAPHWLWVAGDCSTLSYPVNIAFYRGTQTKSYAANTAVT